MCEMMSSSLGPDAGAMLSSSVACSRCRIMVSISSSRGGGTAGGGYAKDVVLLQFVRRIGAEPVPNLRREAVQLLVLADVELRQQVNQIENVGHQRRMERRLWLLKPVGHVADHALEPAPQVLSSLLERLPYVRVDLASDARLFLSRHGDAEVVSAGDGHLELQAKLLAQRVCTRVVLLSEEAMSSGSYVLDIVGIEIEEVVYLLREPLLKLTHASREIKVKVSRERAVAFI
jgi:hypothetical protein